MAAVVAAALAGCGFTRPAAGVTSAGGARPATAGAAAAPTARALAWPEVLRLRAAHDYFALRERLDALAGPDAAAPPARFARALVQHAFNASAASNATIEALLADAPVAREPSFGAGLPDSLVTALRIIQVANDLRLGAYAAGLAHTDALLADTARLARRGAALDTAALRDLRDGRRLFRALAGVPPQAATLGPAATLRLERGRVPVRVNDSARHYVFDTGANLSTLMRSEARALGLRLYPAGLDVATSTDQHVTGDLAVADRLTLGTAEFRHVVFLVLDDRALTFPGGFRIPGIIGFPVIAQLGAVAFGRGGELVLSGRAADSARGPAPAPARANLALEGLTPLTRARWDTAAAGGRSGTTEASGAPGAPLLCALDTGADRTQFYEPFYRRFRARLDAAPGATRGYGGAGGMRALPVRVLRPVRLAVGDTSARLDSADVLTRPIRPNPDDNFLDCNLGHDVLDAFARYEFDFRAMSFRLR